jgi:hypothetical protein
MRTVNESSTVLIPLAVSTLFSRLLREECVGNELFFGSHGWQIALHQFEAPRLLLPPLLPQPQDRFSVAFIDSGAHIIQ